MNKGNAYDNSVELYEEWFIENNNILDTEIQIIKDLLPDSAEGIEIGVGTGIFSFRLGIKHGVEPAKRMRQKAIDRGIEVTAAYAENLPIASESYKFALMVTVDCFLEDVIKAFREVWRILDDDGFFIIAFLDRETPLGTLYDHNKHSDSFYGNANFNSAKEIEEYLLKTGFYDIEKKQTIYTLDNISQEIKTGTGEGVFAVFKAKKQEGFNFTI